MGGCGSSSFDADEEHDQLPADGGSYPRDPPHREKVKVLHAERTRAQDEDGRLGDAVCAGVRRVVDVQESALGGRPSGDGEVFWVGLTPSVGWDGGR